MGGYYGGLLARAGLDVHFLLNSDYDHVRQHGLSIDSVDGSYNLPKVNAYRKPEDMPACDVAIVALKTTHNHLLGNILPCVIKDDGYVLMLQNGLGIEAQAAAIVGEDRVLGGLCFLCSNKTRPGGIHHLDYGQVRLGEFISTGMAAGITPRLKELGSVFKKALIKVDIIEHLAGTRWEKLMWNIPYNGLCVILNITTDKIMAHTQARELVRNIMAEVQQGAKACGFALEDNMIDNMLERTDKMKPYKPSMLLDFEKQKELEVEAIYSAPLEQSKQSGCELPRIQTLYQQLKFLDQKNRGVLP